MSALVPSQAAREALMRASDIAEQMGFPRVGVLIDGKPIEKLTWYDADRRVFRQHGLKSEISNQAARSIEPFWRYPETRQQRRARERWEAKHRHAWRGE